MGWPYDALRDLPAIARGLGWPADPCSTWCCQKPRVASRSVLNLSSPAALDGQPIRF